MTVGQLIDDIELRLFGGKGSDDQEIDRRQIHVWLDQVNGFLLSQYIARRNGGRVPASCMTKFSCEAVETDTPLCYDGCISYKYIQLPTSEDGNSIGILSLPEERGIVQVLRGVQPIYRLDNPAKVRITPNIRFGEQNAYFARLGDKILLFNGNFPSFSKFEVFVVLSDTTNLADTDRYPTVEEILPAILDEVTKIGMAELHSIYDVQDDGNQ